MREEFWIVELKTFTPYGYNMTMGGNTHFTSEETKIKISKANKGHRWTTKQREQHSERLSGRTLTEKWKKNIGASSKGRKHSQSTKDKLSNMRKGKPRSEELKQKLKEYANNRPEEHNKKLSESSIKDIDLKMLDNDSNIIKSFSTFSQAHEYILEQNLSTSQYRTFVASLHNGIKKEQRRYGHYWRRDDL